MSREGYQNYGQLIREIVSALLSVGIATVSLWMLVETFHGAGGEMNNTMVESYNRKKDLLLYALAVLGTVTGYYFGRVPAELRAHSASINAERSKEEALEAQKSLEATAKDAAAAIAMKEHVAAERDEAVASERRVKQRAKAVLEKVKPALRPSSVRRGGGDSGEDATGIEREIDAFMAEL